MEVQAIEVDREEARKRVEEFTAKRRRSLTEMDKALFRGYKALAEGLTLIDINRAIRNGGYFEENFCPKLAIARSDLKIIKFHHRFEWVNPGPPKHGGFFNAWDWGFGTDDPDGLRTRTVENAKTLARGQIDYAIEQGIQIVLDGDVIQSPESERTQRKRWYKRSFQTLVPPIPFHLRPNGDAEKYFILWEVEHWEEWHPSTAPGDPLLLERIAHPIYLVVAQWDLSELEKRILESFRR